MEDKIYTVTTEISASQLPAGMKEILDKKSAQERSVQDFQARRRGKMSFLSNILSGFSNGDANKDIDNRNEIGQKSIKNEIEKIDNDLKKIFLVIGERYAQYLLANSTKPVVDISDVLETLKSNASRKKALEEKLKELARLEAIQKLETERDSCEQEYKQQKIKLDKALAMEIIDKAEYEQRLAKYKNMVLHFDEVKQIEKEFASGLIDDHEKKVRLFELGIPS